MTKSDIHEHRGHERSSKRKFLTDVFKQIRFTFRYFDFYYIGISEVFGYQTYIGWYQGASRVHALNNTDLEDPDSQIPEEPRVRVLPFLEECVKARAIFYTRDFKGFRWFVYDEEAYRTSCQKAGFEDSDFQGYPKLKEP